MRFLRSLFCVLLVCVLSCGLFSVTAFAIDTAPDNDPIEEIIESNSVSTFGLTDEDLESGNIKISSAIAWRTKSSDGTIRNTSGTFYGAFYDNVTPITAGGSQFQDITSVLNSDDYHDTHYTLRITSANDDIRLYDKGQVFDFSAINLLSAVAVYDADGSTLLARSNWYYTGIDHLIVRFYDRVGNYTDIRLDDFNAKQSNDLVNLSFSTTVPADCYEVRIYIFMETPYAGISSYIGGDYIFKASWGFRDAMFAITASEADNSGFFASILEWLRNIRDGVTGLGDKISNVVNSIIELPSRIWSFISDGLKELFIPSEDDMVSIKEDWDTLMSERFGAIYEAGSLIVDWANNFTEQSAKNTVNMPSVSVDLAGTEFTFGGYDVELVPERFSFLVDILKGVIDIVCTLAFVNAMKKRYDNVVGGGSQ